MQANAAMFCIVLGALCLALPSIINWVTVEANILLLVLAAFTFVFWPWMLGLLDIMGYMLTGAQITNLPWTEMGIRRHLLLLWPIVTAFIILAVGSLVS